MNGPNRVSILLAGWSLLAPLAASAPACPFCTAFAPTRSQEFAAVDAVVIATLDRMLDASESRSAELDPEIPMARFSITRVLKGAEAVGARKSLTTVFFGTAQGGDQFLIMGVDPPQLSWSTPEPLNDRQRDYLTQLTRLPSEGPQRLAFFQDYLEHSDAMLARDAYDEFATTPYSMIKQLKPQLNPTQLVAWIEDPQVSVTGRRLYLTLLGVCGGKEHLPMLERRLRADDPQSRSALDALIACYLTLRGPDGVELIEELFLKPQPNNETSSSDRYADVYAAIMALRFHGSEGDVIPRPRVIQAFAWLLDSPPYADMIIPDLARWEDWSYLDRLVKLFKTADVQTSFVRMPIVSYVRACPLPEAKAALDELKRVDAESVQRSYAFYPEPMPEPN
jgi:hypothetical protein